MIRTLALAACAALLLTVAPAHADDDDDDGHRYHRWYDYDDDHRHKHKHYKKHRKHLKKVEKHVYHHHGGRHDHHWHKPKRKKAKKKVYVEKHVYHHYPKKHRHKKKHYHRHGGHHHHHYHKHGHKKRYRDDDRDWAIFAILALQIVDVLNDSQRHSYALAQQKATVAPLGDSIRWHDGRASGQVIPVREGSDPNGNYCREFQQEVIVGNQRQAGYDVACLKPDGSWEIVS